MSLAPLGHTIRRLAGTPTLTVAAVLTLGVSIGAATAIYSAVQAVLLGPLPFRDLDALVVLWQTDLKKGASHIELSTREHDAWRRRVTSFEDLAAVTAANLRVNVTGKGDPVQHLQEVGHAERRAASACVQFAAAISIAAVGARFRSARCGDRENPVE